ncbi:hypothetical protein BGW38_004909, partial [Lunasporangiospora selenospora]
YQLKISAKIDRGFFLASGDWTCYRRNYFQLSACFSVLGLDTSVHSEAPCLLERNGELLQVKAFLVCIGAQIQHGEKVIELVQHTPKRDKGPQMTPRPTALRAGGDLNINGGMPSTLSPTSGTNPSVVTFERVQFKTATANNGKRRAAQQYYQVHVDLYAELDNGELVMVANTYSAPLVVRGRSPGHYADNEDMNANPMDMCVVHTGSDSRYGGGGNGSSGGYHSHRHDSFSSSNGALASPVSPGEYPYYPGGYPPTSPPSSSSSSTYPYQSLGGSASHMANAAAATAGGQMHGANNGGYYDRQDPDSYPTSPLSPVGPHPGEPLSPDVYSPGGFVGQESPSLNRLSQMHGPSYNYGAYSQYPSTLSASHDSYHRDQYSGHHHQQQQQQQPHLASSSSSLYDQDHETGMAGLRIHSPTMPMSSSMSSSTSAAASATGSPISTPMMTPLLTATSTSAASTPRRQSFSSSSTSLSNISKKSERGIGGSTTTRKSRSISLSGTTTTNSVTVTKRAV